MAAEGKKTITLTHPVLGERTYPAETARKILSLENNGGWELVKSWAKKPKSNTIDPSQDAIDAESDNQGDKGAGEEGGT